MEQVVTFNGMLIEGVTAWGEQRRSRSEAATIPRRHGAYMDAKQYLDPRSISLQGKIVKDTASNLRTALDALNAIIEAGRGALMLHDDRFLYALKEGFEYEYIEGSRDTAITYSLDFICDDPFYQSLAPISQTVTLTGAAGQEINIAVDDQGAPVAVAGNAECDPVITIIPSASYTSITLLNSQGSVERQLSFVAAGSAADEIVLNGIDKVCYRNTINALSSFYGNFLSLKGGEINPLIYNGPAGTMTMTYRPRYY
jgi:hypothetical protein